MTYSNLNASSFSAWTTLFVIDVSAVAVVVVQWELVSVESVQLDFDDVVYALVDNRNISKLLMTSLTYLLNQSHWLKSCLCKFFSLYAFQLIIIKHTHAHCMFSSPLFFFFLSSLSSKSSSNLLFNVPSFFFFLVFFPHLRLHF